MVALNPCLGPANRHSPPRPKTGAFSCLVPSTRSIVPPNSQERPKQPRNHQSGDFTCTSRLPEHPWTWYPFAMPTAPIEQPDGIDSEPYSPPPMPPKPYNQACQLQVLAWNRAHDPGTNAASAAALMRVWKELQEQKRIMRMKPAPKPIEVPMPGKGRKSKSASDHWEEPGATPAKPAD